MIAALQDKFDRKVRIVFQKLPREVPTARRKNHCILKSVQDRRIDPYIERCWANLVEQSDVGCREEKQVWEDRKEESMACRQE